MDRAIKEIVSGIVQRSVCVACQTTKELVLKVVHLNLYIFFFFLGGGGGGWEVMDQYFSSLCS